MGTATLRDRLVTTAATAGIAVLGLSAIGCGSSSNTNTSNTVTATGPLTLWHSDLNTAAIEQIASSLSTDNTKITATKVDTAYEWRLINGIAADSAPDVAIIPNDYIADHKDKFVTIPADYIQSSKDQTYGNTKDFFQGTYLSFVSQQFLNSDGTAIAFPGPVKELKLFINRRLFAEASERWRQALQNNDAEYQSVRKVLTSNIATWTDFASASQRITQRSGNNIVVSGAALGVATNVEWAQDVYELMTMQQGGQIVDSTKMTALFQNYEKNADGRLIYPGKDALRYFTSFADPNNPNYSWNSSFSSARAAFLAGQVAMIFDYGEFADTVKEKAKDAVELEVLDVPQLTADGTPVVFVRDYAIGISKGSQQKAKAGSLAKLLATSSAKDLAKSLTDSYSPVSTDNDAAIVSRLANATPIYKKNHSEFDSIMTEMLNDVILNGQTADNAVDRAAEKINQVLNK